MQDIKIIHFFMTTDSSLHHVEKRLKIKDPALFCFFIHLARTNGLPLNRAIDPVWRSLAHMRGSRLEETLSRQDRR